VTEWVTQREAAALLGVHVSLVGKLVARGDLHPRVERPSLSRAEVVALAEERARPKPAETTTPPDPEEPWTPQPPDDEHEWLTSDEAAELLGLTRNGVNYRAQKGKLPYVRVGWRRWFRLDHLELVLRAEQARSTLDR